MLYVSKIIPTEHRPSFSRDTQEEPKEKVLTTMRYNSYTAMDLQEETVLCFIYLMCDNYYVQNLWEFQIPR